MSPTKAVLGSSLSDDELEPEERPVNVQLLERADFHVRGTHGPYDGQDTDVDDQQQQAPRNPGNQLKFAADEDAG
jgi:hypothetical protein